MSPISRWTVNALVKTLVRGFDRHVLNVPRLVGVRLFCKYYGIAWHKSWVFRGWPIIRKHSEADISIGERVTLVSDPKHNSWGITQPVVIRAGRKGASITIGNDVGLSGCTITAIERIVIGDEVLVGSGVVIADNDAHPVRPEGRRYGTAIKSAPVVVGDNVFLGARSLILKGVTIGRGAVDGGSGARAVDGRYDRLITAVAAATAAATTAPSTRPVRRPPPERGDAPFALSTRYFRSRENSLLVFCGGRATQLSTIHII